MKITVHENEVWSKEKLAEWAAKKAIQNPIYLKAAEEQLEEWTKGNNIHNPHSRIIEIVDENENIVGYSQLGGGECCPDFACCEPNTSRHWNKATREHFYKTYKTQGIEACAPLLMMALASVEVSPEIKTYVAGQAGETVQ